MLFEKTQKYWIQEAVLTFIDNIAKCFISEG